MTSWKFEGVEKRIDEEKFIGSIYLDGGSLKFTEVIVKNGLREIIEQDISTSIVKYETGLHLCLDYSYKIFCRKISEINNSKLILVQGPNIYTYKRISNIKD